MIEFISVCGVWSFNANQVWKFIPDPEYGGSLSTISEDITFTDLVKAVADDYCFKDAKSVKLSFALPSTEELPMFIRNDRQTQVFVKKLVEFGRSLHLCVTVDEGQTRSGLLNSGNTIGFSNDVDVANSSVLAHISKGNSSDSVFPASSLTSNCRNQPQTSSSPQKSSAISGSSVRCEDPVSESTVKLTRINVVPDETGLYVGKIFKSKAEMTKEMQILAESQGFQFRSPRSDRTRVHLCCIDPGCCWVFRAKSFNKTVGSFVVSAYIGEHSCDSSLRNINGSKITSKVIGELVSQHYEGGQIPLLPRQIMQMFKSHDGAGMSYSKALRAQSHAIDFARGTASAGYEDLPSWLYMLEKTNPGSATFLKVDDHNRFKYAFVAIGASIRGFKLMKKVISIDGSHLKAKFKGTLLAASAQDGNLNLYPLAFAVVDSENDESWDWFLKCLKTIIPDEEDLVIVSDRAPCIAKGIFVNYPISHHGICYFHFEKNLELHFKCSTLIPVVKNAAYAYTRQECDALFSEIYNAHPRLADYLWKADISKWARAYAPANRYNIMTSNLAECLNSLLCESREYPVVYLFETIRSILSRWFYERREASMKHRHAVSKNVGAKITALYNSDARKFNVAPVDRLEFEVKGDKFIHVVNLDRRECSCRFFDIERYPCSHAIAAAKKLNLNENDFVDVYYLTERWILAYSESIHPVGDKAFWDIPDEIAALVCLPPITRIPSGRHKKARYSSGWEYGKSNSKSQTCSRCLKVGHKKTNCVAPI